MERSKTRCFAPAKHEGEGADLSEKRRLIFSDDAISGTMQWVTVDWGGRRGGMGQPSRLLGKPAKATSNRISRSRKAAALLPFGTAQGCAGTVSSREHLAAPSCQNGGQRALAPSWETPRPAAGASNGHWCNARRRNVSGEPEGRGALRA